MKVKIQAGAELETVTPDELDSKLRQLQSWLVEIRRGPTIRNVTGYAAKAGGQFTIASGKPTDDRLGPRGGYVWSITRLYVAGNGYTTGTDQFSIYRTTASAGKIVAGPFVNGKEWDIGVLLLPHPDELVVAGAATNAAGNDVYLSIGAVELPVESAWQFLG
jgi:hypothetical protein